ncbi:MAG TPA: hypothetical protein VGG04_03505, partial [Candidatus Sulfotelmatobacter sp.]
MRHSSLRFVTGVSCLLFGAAAWRLGPHSAADFAAEAQTVKAAPPQQAQPSAPLVEGVSGTARTAKLSIPAEPKPIIAPGSELYSAKRGEAIPTIARKYLGKTSYLTSSELADAIRSVNHKSEASNILKANENIIIPGILPAPITEKTVPVARDFEVRAIYLTGVM